MNVTHSHLARHGFLTQPGRALDAVAALAQPETEFATAAVVRRAKETGLARAVEGLALLDQIHTVTVCTTVMLPEVLGRAGFGDVLSGKADVGCGPNADGRPVPRVGPAAARPAASRRSRLSITMSTSRSPG